jgi:hypothetical protein
VNLEKVRVRVKKVIMNCGRIVYNDPEVSPFYCLPAPHFGNVGMEIITHATNKIMPFTVLLNSVDIFNTCVGRLRGHAVMWLVEALCYKSRVRVTMRWIFFN